MNLKRLYSVFSLFLVISTISFSQNVPTFDTPFKDTVIVNSGLDILIIPNISNGDTIDQELTIEATSSDESILKVDSITYNDGDKLALIWVTEQGVLGTVDVNVSVSDLDGTTDDNFQVQVTEYPHHGIKFEIHDAIFWQEVIPLDNTPVYESIIQSTNLTAAYNALNWGSIPLTVGAGCTNPSLCDGHDFATGFLEGFLVPKKSGNYNFYINGDAQYALFLSSDEKFSNAEMIAGVSDNHGTVGEAISGRKSAAIPLDSGKVYAIYAVQWNVHQETGYVKWELPGTFSSDYLSGANLYPLHDTQRPNVVENLKVNSVGDEFVSFSWNKSSDDQKLKGYNIYQNGLKINTETITETKYVLSGLTASTQYSIAVTSVDLVYNESLINTIVNFETLPLDTVPPSPPTNLSVLESTGLALEVSWEGASDEQTSIFGYNLYIDGELYNTDSLITSNNIILKILTPETEYDIEIESIDAGENVSGKSQVFVVSTSDFDPLASNLGLKTGRLVLSSEAMSFNEGIGVNPDFVTGTVLNAAHTDMLSDLKPGAIRWGALTANPLNFKDYSGAYKRMTIGQFINRCNEFNSYTAFCCGVENSTDWRQNPETFITFLEYINGPDDTPGGQLRVAEGFTEPFLNNSPGIIFEFGNEVWGRDAHNAQIGSNYTTYANWCREMATKMKASEYYDSSKIVFAYSSRYPSMESSYGLNEQLIDGGNGEVEWTAPSGYLGGNLNYDPAFPPAESELDYYKNVKDRADIFLQGMYNSHKYEVVETGRLLEQYMYESNTTTPTYNGRLGQAIISTDYYLTAMELGSAIPTIFHLTGGQWRITEQENNYRRLPLFLTAKYFNNFCKGDVLYNTYHSNGNSDSEQGALFRERPVGAHSYKNKEGFSIVLMSRDFVEDHYVEVDLPDDLSFNSNGKMYLITGEDFSTKNAIVDSTEITVLDSMIVKVPKYSMVLINFELNDPQLENLPLAYFPYPRIEDIEIVEGNHQFTESSETKRFNISISPSNSWDKKVVWTLMNNSGNYGILPHDTYCTVYVGSDLTNETDSMILRASSRAGDVYDEVILYPDNPPVHTENIQLNSDYKVYPNPVNDVLKIESIKDSEVRLFNVQGIKVYEEKLDIGLNRINTSNLPKGIYTLQLDSDIKWMVIKD